MEDEKRKRFFEILGIEDDGRRNQMMTRDEFQKFCEGKRLEYDPRCFPFGKNLPIIYFEFSAYTDDTYCYDEETDTVYRDSYSIGD